MAAANVTYTTKTVLRAWLRSLTLCWLSLHKETQGQQMEPLYGTRAINLKWKESTEEINGK